MTPAQPATSPGWWRRNWKWAVPAFTAGALLVCGGFALALYSVIAGVMEGSEPYRQAMARAAAVPAVAERLGLPLARDGMFQGEIATSGSSGRVDISFPVKGPKGTGTLLVAGTASGGKWTYTTLEIRLPGGEAPILLLPKPPPPAAVDGGR